MVREGSTNRRYAVIGIVVVAHAVLIELALRHQQSLRMEKRSDESLLILLPPRAEVPPSTAPLPRIAPPPQIASPPRIAEPRRAATASPPQDPATGDFAISLDAPSGPISDGLPLRLGVDWDREATQVADAQAVSIFKELKHVCEQAALRGEQPPGCHKYRKPDAWSPEPKKFGFAGALPYVRLSKRCILGLGFFGCGIGHLPEADGHVLDDMRDPDRPRSSVPNPNDPDD